MTKAVLNGDRILCGKCYSLLAKRVQGYTCINKTTTEYKENGIEIKCKNKQNGSCCNEMNLIVI